MLRFLLTISISLFFISVAIIACDTATESQDCLKDCEQETSLCSEKCDVEYYAGCWDDCLDREADCKDDCGGGGGCGG